jgi:hypothetical protein
MAKPTRATQAKRNRERSKNEKQQEKRFERNIRKEQRKLEGLDGVTGPGEDPDLAGIVPGPQPQSP